jgi:hypothetical protein
MCDRLGGRPAGSVYARARSDVARARRRVGSDHGVLFSDGLHSLSDAGSVKIRTTMRRIVLALALCFVVSPAIFAASNTHKAPKVKAHKAKAHKAQKAKKASKHVTRKAA